MTPEDLQKMQSIIEASVEKSVRVTVNGRIDKINHKLDEHIIQHKKDRERLEPVIIAFEGKSYIYRLFISYMAPLGMAGGLAAGLVAVVELFIQLIHHP